LYGGRQLNRTWVTRKEIDLLDEILQHETTHFNTDKNNCVKGRIRYLTQCGILTTIKTYYDDLSKQ